MVKYLNHSNFDNTIMSNEVVLVDFFTEWCGPCKLLYPTIEAVANDFENKAVVTKINVDTYPELASAYGVRSLPALYYFKNGRVVDSEKGIQTKADITDKLESLLSNSDIEIKH